MNTACANLRITNRLLLALMILFSAALVACTDDESEPTDTNEVVDDSEDEIDGADDADDIETDEDSDDTDDTDDADDAEDTGGTDDATSDVDDGTDSVSYPFDVSMITSGCEGFDKCGTIDTYGGSIASCLDYAAELVEDAPDCVDELEVAFTCAANASGTCDFADECAVDGGALVQCQAGASN